MLQSYMFSKALQQGDIAFDDYPIPIFPFAVTSITDGVRALMGGVSSVVWPLYIREGIVEAQHAPVNARIKSQVMDYVSNTLRRITEQYLTANPNIKDGWKYTMVHLTIVHDKHMDIPETWLRSHCLMMNIPKRFQAMCEEFNWDPVVCTCGIECHVGQRRKIQQKANCKSKDSKPKTRFECENPVEHPQDCDNPEHPQEQEHVEEAPTPNSPPKKRKTLERYEYVSSKGSLKGSAHLHVCLHMIHPSTDKVDRGKSLLCTYVYQMLIYTGDILPRIAPGYADVKVAMTSDLLTSTKRKRGGDYVIVQQSQFTRFLGYSLKDSHKQRTNLLYKKLACRLRDHHCRVVCFNPHLFPAYATLGKMGLQADIIYVGPKHQEMMARIGAFTFVSLA